MTHYHVVVNVPGYLPMSENDYLADTREDAVAAVKAEGEYHAEGYRGRDDIEPAYADDGLYAYIVEPEDDANDLGLVIEAIACTDDHTEDDGPQESDITTSDHLT